MHSFLITSKFQNDSLENAWITLFQAPTLSLTTNYKGQISVKQN